MKVVINEEQYRVLLSEQFKQDVDSILKSSYEFTKDIVKTAEQQLKTSFQFLLTYGAGIGSLARPLSEYLQGKLEELKDAIEKTKSIENRFVKILNQLGVYIYSVLDIPAYTFLLPVIPF